MKHWLILNYFLLDNLAQNPQQALFQINFCIETYLGTLRLITRAFRIIERSTKVFNVLFNLKWVVSDAATVTSASLILIALSMAINWLISTYLLWFDIYLMQVRIWPSGIIWKVKQPRICTWLVYLSRTTVNNAYV